MKQSFTFTLALALLVGAPVCAQSNQTSDQKNQDKNAQQEEIDPQLKPTKQPPRSDDSERSAGESSSKDRSIDLSPPTNDTREHPGSGGPIEPANGVMEMKPWNPHQADKDIEVGLYYFREKNYKAAESRYRSALYWQDNSAEAHYRLGEVLEKTGRIEEARENYQAYLKVLPEGSFAKDARKALDRMAKTEGAKKTASTSRP